jgi:hypothetical protein
MTRRWVVSLASILMTASFVFGQVEEVQPVASQDEALRSGSQTEFGNQGISASDAPRTSYFNDFPFRSPGAFSVQPEYMLWFLKGSRANFPISTTDILGMPIGNLGEISDTQVGQGPVSGGRLTFGYWEIGNNPWIPERSIKTLGCEMRLFFVASRTVDFMADTAPNLARPFFDLNNRMESAFLVAAPGIATGSIIGHANVSIWGTEVNVWKNIYYDKPGTTVAIDLMAGFRYLNGNSEIDISSISVFNQTIAAGSAFASLAGNRLQVQDSFATRNHFYGGQVGIKGQGWFIDYLRVEGSLRLALGNTSQDVTIAGSQVRTFADGRTAIANAGLFALSSNIGNHHTNMFSQVPEGDLKAFCPIGDHLTFSIGFSALYWNRVLRAVDQVDRSLDITQIPNFPAAAGATATGLGRPVVPLQRSDLWVLGLSFGLEVKW